MSSPSCDRPKLAVSLDLLYVALENLVVTLAGADELDSTLEEIVVTVEDLKESIVDYWRACDPDVEQELLVPR
jgi:hypothetical protein